MPEYFTPIALSAAGDKHLPAVPGTTLDPALLPLSQVDGNLLTAGENGLVLKLEDLISKQEPNALVAGVDDKLRIDASKLVQGDVLTVTDNKIGTALKLVMNNEANTLYLLGKDDAVVAEAVLPVVPGLPIVTEVLDNFQPPKPNGYEENPYPVGAYLHWRFKLSDNSETDLYVNVSKLADIYVGGTGITIDGYTISADTSELVSPKEGNAITVEDGKLFAKISITADNLGAGLALKDGKLVLELDPDSPLIMTEDGKLSVDASKIAHGVSTDAGNILKNGADGRAFLASDLGSL